MSKQSRNNLDLRKTQENLDIPSASGSEIHFHRAGQHKPDFVALSGFDQENVEEILSSHFGHKSLEIPINGDKLTLEWVGKLKLSNVLVAATECSKELQFVQEQLSIFASKNEQLAQGQKIVEPKLETMLLANFAQKIMILSHEAFGPAHRLCQAIIGLYMTEDFIRNPKYGLLDDDDRIKLPSQASNKKTCQKFKACADLAANIFATFAPVMSTSDSAFKSSSTSSKPGRPGPGVNQQQDKGQQLCDEMRETLLIFRRALQDLHTAGIGSIDLLNMLLYIDFEEKRRFANFIMGLPSFQKTDLLEDISCLRRTIDLIPLTLERLSWASSTVFGLAAGNSSNTSRTETPTSSNAESQSSLTPKIKPHGTSETSNRDARPRHREQSPHRNHRSHSHHSHSRRRSPPPNKRETLKDNLHRNESNSSKNSKQLYEKDPYSRTSSSSAGRASRSSRHSSSGHHHRDPQC